MCVCIFVCIGISIYVCVYDNEVNDTQPPPISSPIPPFPLSFSNPSSLPNPPPDVYECVPVSRVSVLVS